MTLHTLIATLLLTVAGAASAGESPSLRTQQIEALHDALGETRYLLFAYGAGHHSRVFDVVSHVFALDALQETDARLDVQAAVASGLIQAQLRAGLDADALDTFDGLPAPLRERMLHGAPVCATPSNSRRVGANGVFMVLDLHPRVIGAAVAMALANADRGDEARTMLAALGAFAPFPKGTWDCGLDAAAERMPDCVASMIGAAPFDPYRWRFGGDPYEAHHRCPALSDARGYLRAADARLEAAGLPDAWRPAFAPNHDPDLYDTRQDVLDAVVARDPAFGFAIDTLRPRLAAVDARDAALIARHRRIEDALFERVDADASALTSDAGRSLARTLRERLAATLYDPYRSESIEPAPGAAVPADCAPGVLRCAADGGVQWELYMSQDVDPTGEVPAAGYWLRRRDGDAVRAYYLGIREHQPYVLAPRSTLPLVADGTLQFDMDVKQLDPESITFPPMALAFEQGGAVRITASIAAIARDVDGDGLTDLIEQRLLLDPHAADSDGDGIDDGDDPMPNVAYRADAGERSRAMAAALNLLQGGHDAAVSYGVAGSEHSRSDGRRRCGLRSCARIPARSLRSIPARG